MSSDHGLTAFVSGRRKQAKIVRDRFNLRPSFAGRSVITTTGDELASLPLRFGESPRDITIVLCRGYGLIVGIRHVLDLYHAQGARLLDEWGHPARASAPPESMPARGHVDDHPAVHPRGAEPPRAPALVEAVSGEAADRGVPMGAGGRSEHAEDR